MTVIPVNSGNRSVDLLKKKFLQSSMIVPRRTRAWSSAAVMPFTLVAAGESERSAFVMQSMTQRLPFDWSDLFIIKREAA